MEHLNDATPLRGLAVSALVLGILGLALCWWFPFGLFLSASGFLLGVFCWLSGIRGGSKGERFGLGGAVLCGAALTINLALGWSTYVRLLGL